MVKKLITFCGHDGLLPTINPNALPTNAYRRFILPILLPATDDKYTTVRIVSGAAATGSDYLGANIAILCHDFSNATGVGGDPSMLGVLIPSAMLLPDPVQPARYDAVSSLALNNSCSLEFAGVKRQLQLSLRVVGTNFDIPTNWIESISTDPDYLALSIMLEVETHMTSRVS